MLMQISPSGAMRSATFLPGTRALAYSLSSPVNLKILIVNEDMRSADVQRHVRQAGLLAIAEQRESVDPGRARAAGFIGCLNKPIVQLELHGMLRRLRGQLI
jgi:hypothetical protein